MYIKLNYKKHIPSQTIFNMEYLAVAHTFCSELHQAISQNNLDLKMNRISLYTPRLSPKQITLLELPSFPCTDVVLVVLCRKSCNSVVSFGWHQKCQLSTELFVEKRKEESHYRSLDLFFRFLFVLK